MSKPQTVYKIQNARGEFRSEGDNIYTKVGKVWRRFSDLMNHLKYHTSTYDRYSSLRGPIVRFNKEQYLDQFPEGDVVIEYEIVERRRMPLRELMAEHLPSDVH